MAGRGAGGAATPRWEPDPTRTERADWAEFVTLALAGAAANVGGIETALMGRSGSWEADGVRQLLASTVGPDEEDLWSHRTEPVDITLFVDELLAQTSEAHAEDERDLDAVRAEYDAAVRADPIDWDRFVWRYLKDEAGRLVPADPAAPAWDLEVGKATMLADPDHDPAVSAEAVLDSPMFFEAHVPKSPELGTELRDLEQARDARLDPIADLEEGLWEQQRREWTEYGAALRAQVEARAAATPGLDVPVRVRVDVDVDVDTYRPVHEQSYSPGLAGLVEPETLEGRLVDGALEDVTTPVDLPGTPLERLRDSEPSG